MYNLRETCEKEFKTITDYIPVVQSHLHDDGDDKATDAYDQDDDEGAYVADNGDDDAAVMNDNNHRQYNKGTGDDFIDNQKYDDQLTKDAHGDCNNQIKDVQGDDKQDDHISRCVEIFKVNVQLIYKSFVG